MTRTADALDRLAAEWRAARDGATRTLAVRNARALLQDRATRDLAWFVAAFDDPDRWAFAVNVVHGVLPRKLLRPILAAAVRHPNVSSNRWFVYAALHSFGADEVWSILDEHLAAASDREERGKVRAARYWVPYMQARVDSERIRRRIRKLSAEQRLRLFMVCDEQTQRELVWMLPYNAAALRPLLDEVIEFARRQNNGYVLAVLRDMKVI